MSDRLNIKKTEWRKEKWRELKRGLDENTTSKALDRAVKIALNVMEKRKEEFEELEEKWDEITQPPTKNKSRGNRNAI